LHLRRLNILTRKK